MILYDNWAYRERWNKLLKSLRARLEAAQATPPDDAPAGSSTPQSPSAAPQAT
jgi:hypothetical protein